MPLITQGYDDDINEPTMRMQVKQVTPGPPAQGTAPGGLPTSPAPGLSSIIPDNFWGFFMMMVGLR